MKLWRVIYKFDKQRDGYQSHNEAIVIAPDSSQAIKEVVFRKQIVRSITNIEAFETDSAILKI